MLIMHCPGFQRHPVACRVTCCPCCPQALPLPLNHPNMWAPAIAASQCRDRAEAAPGSAVDRAAAAADYPAAQPREATSAAELPCSPRSSVQHGSSEQPPLSPRTDALGGVAAGGAADSNQECSQRGESPGMSPPCEDRMRAVERAAEGRDTDDGDCWEPQKEERGLRTKRRSSGRGRRAPSTAVGSGWGSSSGTTKGTVSRRLLAGLGGCALTPAPATAVLPANTATAQQPSPLPAPAAEGGHTPASSLSSPQEEQLASALPACGRAQTEPLPEHCANVSAAEATLARSRSLPLELMFSVGSGAEVTSTQQVQVDAAPASPAAEERTAPAVEHIPLHTHVALPAAAPLSSPAPSAPVPSHAHAGALSACAAAPASAMPLAPFLYQQAPTAAPGQPQPSIAPQAAACAALERQGLPQARPVSSHRSWHLPMNLFVLSKE